MGRIYGGIQENRDLQEMLWLIGIEMVSFCPAHLLISCLKNKQEIMSRVLWLEKERHPNEEKLDRVLKEKETLGSDAEQKCQPAGLDPKESKCEFKTDFCHLTRLLWPFIDFTREITGSRPLGSVRIKMLWTLHPFAICYLIICARESTEHLLTAVTKTKKL